MVPFMNKTEFVDLLSKELGQSQVKTSHILNSVLKLIVEVMKENDELKIVGFGTFKAKNCPSVIMRTPSGDMTDVPSKRRVKFTASKVFKDMINT